MAQATKARERATIYLRFIEPMVDDLYEIADEWETIATDERISWSLDWSNEMGKLDRLAGYASEGALSAEQQAAYRRARQRVEEALPVIRRLGLSEPKT